MREQPCKTAYDMQRYSRIAAGEHGVKNRLSDWKIDASVTTANPVAPTETHEIAIMKVVRLI
jgi:hypothetical protein